MEKNQQSADLDNIEGGGERQKLLSNELNAKEREEGTGWLSKVKGVSAVMLYVVLVSTSRVCVQALDRAVPHFELNAIRCGFAMVCMGFYFIICRHFPSVSRDKMAVCITFVSIQVFSPLGSYVSVTYVSLASAECLYLTSLVVSGILIFTIWNRERIKWESMVTAPLCILGVVMVIQPPFIFGNSTSHLQTKSANEALNQNITQNITEAGKQLNYNITMDDMIGYSLSVGVGILDTFIVSFIKYHSDFFTTDNLLISLSWSYVAGTVLSLITMLLFEKPVFPLDIKDLLLVSGHVLTYVLLMPLHLYGSLLISGNLGSIIKTSRQLFMLVAQYLFLANVYPGHRNWIEVVGVVLVTFGSVFSSVVEIVKSFRKNF